MPTSEILAGAGGSALTALALYLAYLREKGKTKVEVDKAENELLELILDASKDNVTETRSDMVEMKLEYREDIRLLKREIDHLAAVAKDSKKSLEELITLCTRKLKDAGVDTMEIKAAGIFSNEELKK